MHPNIHIHPQQPRGSSSPLFPGGDEWECFQPQREQRPGSAPRHSARPQRRFPRLDPLYITANLSSVGDGCNVIFSLVHLTLVGCRTTDHLVDSHNPRVWCASLLRGIREDSPHSTGVVASTPIPWTNSFDSRDAQAKANLERSLAATAGSAVTSAAP